MVRGLNRIPVTHVGSLPRPHALLDIMKLKLNGEDYDPAEYDRQLTASVAAIVEHQVDIGIDLVSDGECSKPSFYSYIQERLTGYEARPDAKFNLFQEEVAAFPDYYQDYFARAMGGSNITPVVPLFCVGPVQYVGQDALEQDLDNLKKAVAGVECEGAFVPSTAPSGTGYNEYYKTDEEFFMAASEAMRVEYTAIVEAGFLVQIDDPFLTGIFVDPGLDTHQKSRKADMYVEAINHALRGIPEEKVRFHTCYGINEGPRVYEAPVAEVAGHMLKINASVYSFEAANPRHEHEYRIWEDIELPDGKAIMPGVITHASNIVEHPQLIADWLVRFAERVGRENVIAGADCGFSSVATYKTEVHPTVIDAKFKAMVEGAEIASRTLW